MPNPTNKIKEELKQAIQKAVPEIFIDGFADSTLAYSGYDPHYRPITLADVLRAIEKRKLWPPYRIGTHGLFFVAKEISATSPYISTGISWDLSKDLDGQSKETINFLHSIICKT